MWGWWRTCRTWKLAEYVNVETGKVEAEPEPKEDCGRCYTIDFITNTKGTGRSILNVIEIDLSDPPFFGTMTEVGDNEIGNVTLFYDAIRSIKSYTLERDELKFFYDEGQRYLLYKLVRPWRK